MLGTGDGGVRDGLLANAAGSVQGRGYGAARHVTDQTQEAQRSKLSVCLHHRVTNTSLKALNVIYTFTVSLLFSSFAYRHAHDVLWKQISYPTSSFLMNAPMAWYFADNAAAAFKRLSKKETPYIVAFTLASLLAAGTTAAGIQVAAESVSNLKSLPGWLVALLTIASTFNTFSTRFIGSIALLHAIFQGVIINQVNKRRACYRDYYQFLEDLKTYGDEIKPVVPRNDGESDAAWLGRYAIQFYDDLGQANKNPGHTWTHSTKNAGLFLGSLALISIFVINMTPLWLNLTVGGIKKINNISFMNIHTINWNSVAQNTPVVWFAAASNQLFYMRSGIKFLPTLASILSLVLPALKTKMLRSPNSVRFGYAFATLIAFVVWSASACFSGAGYSEDGSKAMEKGFGEIADDTWFSWFAGSWTQLFMPVYDDFVAMISAGLIVNGNAALAFLMSSNRFIHFFKAPEPKQAEEGVGAAKTLIQEKIDANKLSDLQGAQASIQQARNEAEPIPSLWTSIWKARLRCCLDVESRDSLQMHAVPTATYGAAAF